MKTKIIINNEEVEITLTPEQVDAITAQLEPQGGKYTIFSDSSILSGKDCKWFGTEYQTQAQAERGIEAMRSRNRLLDWCIENDDGWVADWKNMSQEKYYIYFDVSLDKYIFDIQYGIYNLATIYMSEQNAEKLCKLLNSGEVVL